MERYASEANDRWVGFEHRADDIVISTRSKCGTTWLQMICALLVFQDPELPAPLAELSPWLDWEVEPLDLVQARLAAQSHRRIIKTHTPLDGLPLHPDVTYIVAGRHPLDVAVSLYHHGQNIDRDRFEALTGLRTASPTGSIEEWVEGWLDPKAGPDEALDTLPGLVHHVTDAWARRQRPSVVLVHYRDLGDDTEEAMRVLAGRLGIEVAPKRLPALVEAATFASMRRRADERVPDRLGVVKDARRFFRSGTSGGGEAVLGPDVHDRCMQRVKEQASPEVAHWLVR